MVLKGLQSAEDFRLVEESELEVKVYISSFCLSK